MPNEAELAQSYSVVQQFKFREAHLKLVGQNLIGKVKEATLTVEITEGLFKGIDSDKYPYITEFIIKPHIYSLKSILGINLAGSFELLLIDGQQRSRLANLRKKMDHELMTSTRGAHIFAIDIN